MKSKNTYFDAWEFNKAKETFDTNPYEAKVRLENYLQKYPLDNSAYIYYINILITLGIFEEANKAIIYVEQKLASNPLYANDIKKMTIHKSYMLYNKLRLLCLLEKYEEAYKLHLSNKDIIDDEYAKIVFYCKKKLNLLDEKTIKDRGYLPYFYRQVVDYQESDFLYHTKKHCNDFISNNKINEAEFAPDFPIDEIIHEVKKYLSSEKKLYPGFVDEAYVFRYDGCGTYNKGIINYFKVICFHKTKNIITMYPDSKCEHLPYVDLNYLRKDSSKTMVKIPSQIDKFNKKFGIK